MALRFMRPNRCAPYQAKLALFGGLPLSVRLLFILALRRWREGFRGRVERALDGVLHAALDFLIAQLV